MLHPRGAPQTSGHHEYVILSTLQRPRGNILSTSVACNDAATTVNEHAVRVATQYIYIHLYSSMNGRKNAI